MQNAKNILQKLQLAYSVYTNKELASRLNIAQGSVDSWSARNKIPDKYLTRCVEDTGVSLEWLLDEDKPTFHISGGAKNISQVNGNVHQSSNEIKNELELFEEFKKIENLAKMANKVDFLKDELEKIKDELKKYI